MGKTKIVLDTDIIIDFKDGNQLFKMPQILPDYEFVLFDFVLNSELSKWHNANNYVLKMNKMIKKGPKINIIPWKPDRETQEIYANLKLTKGKGESACMAYCKTHKDVLGSCNLSDTRKYCEENGIRYVTFLDLIWYAWKNGVLSENECNQCIQDAIRAGNKIPNKKVSDISPTIADL